LTVVFGVVRRRRVAEPGGEPEFTMSVDERV
jgi:hypothetical protein